MEIKLNKITYKNFKDLKIKFKEGLINGVLGGNGSGKTSLTDILCLLNHPKQGYLELDGVTIDFTNPMINYEIIRFEIGFVPQNIPNYIFCDTVKEQMMYGLNQYQYKNNIDYVKKSLKMVGLDETLINRKIATLSDGELFKFYLANSLALNPQILILDEPTTFLDNKSKNDLVKLLRILKNRYHKTIIILSKDADFLYEISDYIYILEHNKIVSEDTKYDLFKNMKTNKYDIILPQIVAFEKKVMENKKIKIGYRDNINDLLKDIYFYK